MEIRKSQAVLSTFSRILLVVVMVIAALTGRPASAAISHRAAIGGNNADGATTLVITKPSSPSAIVAGDVMIAVVTVRGGTGTTISTVPTNWQLINSNTSGTDIRSSTYYKVATALEPPSYIWGWATSLKASGVISAYSGVDTVNPIMAQGSQANASLTTMTAPAVTTTVDGAMVIAAYGSARGTTFSVGSSMNLRAQSASSGGGPATQTTSGLQDVVQATAGTTGTKTMTAASAAVSIGHTIALNPKPTFEQSGYRWFQDSTTTTDLSPITFAKSWGGVGYDTAQALVLDTSGNIYAVGQTNSTGLTAGGYDQTLVKYNSSGVEQWSKTWGGTGSDRANALALDTSGNIYVAGYTDSTGLTAGSYDQTLVKYNSSGALQWSKTWGGDGYDEAHALALDTSGNIYVAGYTDSTGLTAGSYDQTLVKYNSSGVEQWSKTWGGMDSEHANALALDASGNIYVAGSTSSTGLTAGLADQTLVKYNASGVEQWRKTWGGTSNDIARALALDSSGNIFVVGSTASTGLTAGGYDQTLVKYNSSGALQWSKTWGGTGTDDANAIALDTSGNIYVAGSTDSIGLTTGANDQTLLRLGSNGSMIGCSSCIDRTMSEVDRTTAEVDRTVTEVDRTTAEVDRTVAEVDRTGVATIIVVCAPQTIDVGLPLNGVAQNTTTTAPGEQQIFRLRTLLHVGGGTAMYGNIFKFKLQYAAMSGTCDVSFTGETYADITTSTPIAYANNTVATDGMGLTANANDPSHSGHSTIMQEYNELNNNNIVNNITPGQDGLWDFALKDNGAAANTSYCFRIVKSDNSLLDAYSVVPQITTPTVTVAQSNHQFFNVNGDGSLGSPVTGSVAEQAPFSLRALLAVNGNDIAAQSRNFKLQYAEKSAGVCQTYDDFATSSTSSTNEPTSYAIDSSVGTRDWTNPGHLVDSGEFQLPASLINETGGASYTSTRFNSHGYSFSVPSNATITGVKIGASGALNVQNGSKVAYPTLQLIVGGTRLSNSESSTNSYVSTGYVMAEIGGSAKLLGASSLTPAQVNASDFGAALMISAFDDNGAPYTAPDVYIQSLSVTVYYTSPPTGSIIHEASSSPAAGSVISANQNDPTAGRPVVLQQYVRTPGFTNLNTIGVGKDGLWDVRLKSGASTAGKTFCFRIVDQSGALLDGYGSTPEVTIGTAQQGLELSEVLRGGQGVKNGTKSPFSF